MTAPVIPLRRRPRSIIAPTWACVVRGAWVPEDAPWKPVVYSLRRARGSTGINGVFVWIHLGPWSWNLSWERQIFPANFAAARLWVAAWAAGYGRKAIEAPPRHPRMAMPTGDDRRLLRAGGCRESWLRSPIPHLWAEAMVRCQSPAAECGSKGACQYGTCDMVMDTPAATDSIEDGE